MDLRIHNTHLETTVGSLAFQVVDALIHPTNNYLWFSTGVSDDLKRRGGEFLEEKAMELGPIEPGQAVLAPAGRLKSRFLIHAAAWGQDMMTNEKLVHRAISSALNLAKENQCETLAVPVTGLSVNAFTLARAIETVFLSVVEHCMQETSLKKIVLLINNEAERTILDRILQTAKNADPPRDETGD
ncbi:macro domain-containing protein [bacterium]|nr:macro domain-containing protein [bacterium]